jgi:hypothetical protein
MKGKNKVTSIKDKLIIIGLVFGLVATCYGIFSYLERYALCETVDKVVQKFEKAMEQMDIRQQKSMDIMDFKLLASELKQVEEQIYQIEKNYGSTPKDPVKKADLERLKRRREEILIEQRMLKEKK